MSERERGGKRESEREERESKILKEKTMKSHVFNERLFYAKISLKNLTKIDLLNNHLKFELF